MPLDMAQFLRNSISVDRYDSLRNEQMNAAPRAEAAQTGSVMGSSFVVEQDPIAELMDSMEELSFAFEEKEMKSIGERKLGEKRASENPFIKALESWSKTFPDMPAQEFTRNLLKMFREMRSSGKSLTLNDFMHELAAGSDDPSHQFAMVDILEQALDESETEFRSLLESARKELLETKGEQIRAGINLAAEVNARATTPAEMQNLRDLYRGEILGFTTPQDCFRSIMGTRGAAGLQAAIDFLTAGCGVDLQSASPSKSPEELRRILTDLQCVQVLKTVLERMTNLASRMDTQFNEHCLMNGEELTGKIMTLTEHSYANADEIGNFIASCGLVKLLARMYFCRELTDVFRQLSSRLFVSERDRLHLVEVAQEHLDGIISEEYNQEEEEEEEKES